MDQVRHADCLSGLACLGAKSAALVYADPPFNSGRDWGAFDDRFASMGAYVDWMRPRMSEMWRVCGGSLYLHCDDSACHHLRVLMDEVCGGRAFRSQIAWRRSNPKGNATRTFGRVTDTILLYARPDAVYNPQFAPLSKASLSLYRHDDGDGRGPYQRGPLCAAGGKRFVWRGYPAPKGGWRMSAERLDALADEGRLHLPDDKRKGVRLKIYLSESRGAPVGNFWADIERAGNAERRDWPTQKPLALLERIVAASSDPGDLVADPFCGSGTTGVAALKLGRRFAGMDVSADAVALARRRIADAGVDTRLI